MDITRYVSRFMSTSVGNSAGSENDCSESK